MLKTAGHVKKHYIPCCVIFEDFKQRGRRQTTLQDYMTSIETIIGKGLKAMPGLPNGFDPITNPDDAHVFRGDMLEVLAELFFKAFANSPQVGLKDYTPVPLEEDFGVDGIGVNATGKKCAVQVKYRGNPEDPVLYAEMARTYTSGVIQMGIPLEGPDCLYVFTTANGVTVACQTVFGKMLRVLNREVIGNEINNNVSFWEMAYNEIAETLGA